MQSRGNTGLRQLPGGLRAGEAAADDMDGLQDHAPNLGVDLADGNHMPNFYVAHGLISSMTQTKTPATSAGAFQADIVAPSGARRSTPPDEYRNG